MVNRFWAMLLILICGVNAIGVNGAALLSERDQDASFIVHVSDESPAYQIDKSDNSTRSYVFTYEDHAADSDHTDCGAQHKSCHQCHLGHCNFLVASASNLIGPDVVRATQHFSTVSYLSIDLSDPRKPPRA